MASEIEGCELDVADGELLGSCVRLGGARVRVGGALTGVEGCGVLAEAVDKRGGQHTGLQDCHAVVLQHVQKGRLSGIVEAEEQKLCVLVGEAERGQEVEDWAATSASCASGSAAAPVGYVELGDTYTCRWLAHNYRVANKAPTS